MNQTLSVASAIELNRLSSDVALICLIDVEVVDPDTGVVSQVLHIARSPDPIEFAGNVYEAGTFDLQVKKEAGRAAEVSLSVNDYTQHLMGLLEEYDGGIGSNVTFYLVRSDSLDQEAEAVEYFQVTAASAANYVIEFTLGAENLLMRTFPARRQTRDFCQSRYKDAETCGYVGPIATCDLTLRGANGCQSHGNSARFGGYPGLNSNGQRYA